MSEQFDPYAVLGVSREATLEEITAAYRRAAKEAHPDREGGSTERMTDINMAYKVLSDAQMREHFDAGRRPQDPDEMKANALISNIVSTAIRMSDPEMNLLELVKGSIVQQKTGLMTTRANTRMQLDGLRRRLKRLRGPIGNVIEKLILEEIRKGEESFPVMEADERIFDKALELLKDYRWMSDYGTAPIVQQVLGRNPYGILGNFGG